MEKRRTFLVNFAYFAVYALIAFVILRYGFGLVAPFVIAFVIAYLLKAPISFISRKFKIKRKPAAMISVLLFYVTVGTIITLVGIKAVGGIADLMRRLPVLYETYGVPYLAQAMHNVEGMLYQLDDSLVAAINGLGSQMLSSLGNLISNLSTSAISLVSGIASSLPGLFIKLVLMIISSFFIAGDYELLTGFCINQLSESSKAIFIQIKEYVVGTLLVCIRSYAIIMSITFVELSIGLSILKINHSILVALCIAVFDILPVLGTGGIMIPWVVLTAVRGNFGLALGLLILYIVITVIRNIIEPKIVGSQLGLHPVVTLASMYAGVRLFGGIGLFGLPIGLSLLRYLNDHGVIKILK
ncbi:MAG: sporulation integral membrane protein YtvI [Oscillospiraceae bacterium]|nr:sporulation integral membrane protein YtvI [Oscillospiraceae bacterium]